MMQLMFGSQNRHYMSHKMRGRPRRSEYQKKGKTVGKSFLWRSGSRCPWLQHPNAERVQCTRAHPVSHVSFSPENTTTSGISGMEDGAGAELWGAEVGLSQATQPPDGGGGPVSCVIPN